MLVALAAALALAAGLQSLPTDRSRAERLARDGETLEALTLFQHVVDANPADVEAQLWTARLELRLGRVADAVQTCRAVLAAHPNDVDARIVLGSALTRGGKWPEALDVLTSAEADAGENSDLFGALARAYQRTGNNPRAIAYFDRARRLAPDDPDLTLGYEAVARTYGHQVLAEGIFQSDPAGGNAGYGMFAGRLRVSPRVHLGGAVRFQNGAGYSDILPGGDVLWAAPGATTITVQAFGASGNERLPNGDVSGEVVHYAGAFEFGGGLRWLDYAGVTVVAASPLMAWTPRDAWRFDGRYSYTQSSFESSGRSSGDHSVLLRETWQAWRRAAIQGAYAYGIESFETLTADRLGSLGASTVAAGLRLDLRSLSRVTATWEHQWRSNDSAIDRLTLSVAQAIP